MSGADCEQLREVAAELALGIADGEKRARALDHLTTCAACRAHLERLAAVADELVLLAPAVEPPPGFEGRVIDQLGPTPTRDNGSRRLLVPAVAALAAAAIAAAAVWIGLSDDRDLARTYRDTLAVANGEYIDAAPLEAPGGDEVGYVYGYQGRTSWVVAVVYEGIATGDYRVELVTTGGEPLRLAGLRASDGEGSVGGATPVPYEEVAEVRLLDVRGREVADAELDR